MQRTKTVAIPIRCEVLEPEHGAGREPLKKAPRFEFHIARKLREDYGFESGLFGISGNVIIADFRAARSLAARLNERIDPAIHPERGIKAGKLNAMGLVDEILHYVCGLYRERKLSDAFAKARAGLELRFGEGQFKALILRFLTEFPPKAVYEGREDAASWLAGKSEGVPNADIAVEELMMLKIARKNPAFEPFSFLFDDAGLLAEPAYKDCLEALESCFRELPAFGPDDQNLVEMLMSPIAASPYSLPGQLEYMRTRWGLVLGHYARRLLSSLDLIKEEEKPSFAGAGPGPSRILDYAGLDKEYERFSQDRDWMPRVVMLAKSSLVWLDQLSRKYGRPILRLDQIPDEELDEIARRGFTALWLIGLWERSQASARIKRSCGNPEAAPSAYSLFDYEIADELGGWPALENLRERALWRGLRLAADMVPNHAGIDSDWVRNRPELFVRLPYSPFPGYTFNGQNLSSDPSIGVYLEDHYYDRKDAAVVFKRVDFRTGETSYLYHGNDGTSMPWNDTAQIDFLRADAREAVIQKILHVAKAFPVIRFDAAMILAKRHFRRLWYPEPGSGGDIASRSDFAMPRADFDAAMPEEFWREVVDRCAREAPDCLLLAEAFWMMEGYFVRTLGMHRVYNSAFMNMLKREENAKYRSTIKNTQEFDKDILKRFVNFMNNPDEETAAAQFGKGDKYFGVCAMMVTMPGLPMVGHGQVEGFSEKYGMEYRKAYWNEEADQGLMGRHESEIFPLMKRRALFSGVDRFLLYDFRPEPDRVNENVFAYSNGTESARALVLYNNAYEEAAGWIREACPYAEKLPDGSRRLVRSDLAEGLGVGRAEGGRERFVALREQRSGLWYLREAKAVAEKGLYAKLRGYECQVYLDIAVLEDDDMGHYRALHEALGGGGAPDLAAALQDIALKELYEAFATLASPAFFRDLRSVVNAQAGLRPKAPTTAAAMPATPMPETAAPKPASLEPEAFIREAVTPAAAFYTVALSFLNGSATWAAFEGAKPRPEANEKEALASFAASLGALFRLASIYRQRPAQPKPDLGSARGQGPASMAEFIVEAPFGAEIAAGFALLDNVASVLGAGSDGRDACALIDHWCLDRKLREALQAAGMPGDQAWRAVALMKAAISRKETAGAESTDPAARAFELYESYASDESVRSLIGVNLYEGVTWFVKERLEALAIHSAVASSLRAPPKAPRGKTGTIALPDIKVVRARAEWAWSVVERVLEAERLSGYRLDALGAALEQAAQASAREAPEAERPDGSRAGERPRAGKRGLAPDALKKEGED